MVSAFLNILVVIIFSTLFVLAGLLVLRSLGFLNDKKLRSYSTEVGFSFFLGVILFLTAWRLFSFLSKTAFVPLLVVVILLVVTVLYNFKFIYSYIHVNLTKYLLSFLFCIIFIVFGIIHALVPMPDLFLSNMDNTLPAYGFGGVVHSLRAGNISVFIAKENYIPILNQNYGQSLLSSIPMFFGLNIPQLTLVVWLSVCMFFLTLIVYGVINLFVKKQSYSVFGTIVTMLGNSALYPIYIEITDTGSTNLLIRSVDTMMGFVTFLIFIIICYLLTQRQNNNINKSYAYSIIAVIGFSWNIIAAHNVVLAILFLGVLFLFVKAQILVRIKMVSIILVFLFFGTCVGLWSGSMLLPSKFADKVFIPGVMSLSDSAQYPLIEFRSKMYLMNFDTLAHSKRIFSMIQKKYFQSINESDLVPSDVVSSSMSVVNQTDDKSILSLFKKNHPLRWVVNLLLIFFPILGFTLFGFVINKPIFQNQYKDFVKMIWMVGIVLFIFGFVCSSFVVLYGKEIEMARFLGIGNFMAMLFLGFSVAYILMMRSMFSWKLLFPFCIIVTLSLVGPFLQYGLVGVVGNFYLPAEVDTRIFSLPSGTPYRTLTVNERFKAMININDMVGTNFKPSN